MQWRYPQPDQGQGVGEDLTLRVPSDGTQPGEGRHALTQEAGDKGSAGFGGMGSSLLFSSLPVFPHVNSEVNPSWDGPCLRSLVVFAGEVSYCSRVDEGGQHILLGQEASGGGQHILVE